jgi:hypothetical protein
VASGQPTVYLRWTMGTTDGGWRYCGWNIDDVQLWGVAAAQPGSIVGARSCLTHGEAGEICLELDPAGIEPRSTGLQLIEFDVSQPAASVNAAVDCVNTLYIGTVTATGYGATVEVEFDPALPDEDCCTIALTGDVGDTFAVRPLAGDSDRGGTVSTGDASIVKPHFGETAGPGNAEFDFDCNGEISTADFSMIKPNFGHEAAGCP